MSLSFEQSLFLIAASGLPRAAIIAARERLALCSPPSTSPSASHSAWNSPANLAALVRIAEAAIPRKFSRLAPRKISWPSEKSIALLAAKLRREQVALCWHGDSVYPFKLAERLSSPPPWFWLAGEPSRFESRSISIVGSRRTPAPFLSAARKLARALSAAGIAVVSGMAEGADSAAHAGSTENAFQKTAGTIAIPAQGILHLDLAPARIANSPWTILGIDRPFEPFTPALAVRRNALIAAMGDALILVASDLQGGSSHAVRWALENGTPIWCFESGRATPPANRQLIRANQARPLPLSDTPEQWLKQILPAMQKARRASRIRQSDLFTPAA